MAYTKLLKDKDGNEFFPVTHESSIICRNPDGTATNLKGRLDKTVSHADTTGTEEELPGLDENIVQIVSKQNEKIDAAMNDIETKYQQFIEAAGGVDSLNRARLIQGIIGIDNAPVFDNAKHYKQDDIVLYRRHVYTFTHEHIGDWDENDVVMTDLFGMYFQARGTMANGEALIVRLTSDTGELNVSGKQVTIAFSDGTAPLTGTTDETGKVAFVIPFGKRYGIVAQAVNDYFPEKKIYVANNYTREVEIRYSYFRFGVYAYFDDGNKMYYDEWVSNGMPSTNEWGGKLVGPAYIESMDEKWICIGTFNSLFKDGVTLYSNSFPESLITANREMNVSFGYIKEISYKLGSIAVTKSSQAAATKAWNMTCTINGVLYRGFLGTLRQYKVLYDNYSKFLQILTSANRSKLSSFNSNYWLPYEKSSGEVFYADGFSENSVKVDNIANHLRNVAAFIEIP